MESQNQHQQQALDRLARKSTARYAVVIKDESHSEVKSLTDPLTQIRYRASFNREVATRFHKHATRGSRMGVIMIDIDNFKRVNDVHGHDIGDQCLVEVAREIQSQLRAGNDFVARLGGEEFIVPPNDIDLDSALNIAERIRPAVELRPITRNHLLLTLNRFMCR